MTIEELCQQGIARVRELQQYRESILNADNGWESSRDTYRDIVVETYDHGIGPFVDIFNQIMAIPVGTNGGTPEPAPVAENWKLLLGGVVGVTGMTKWLGGSTGCDLFVRVQTPIYAPYNVKRVTFAQVPGGPVPIGEMFIYPEDSHLPVARFRHVSSPTNLAGPRMGQQLCRVYDSSMDILRWPRTWQGGSPYPTPPSGYQHLDLSLGSVSGRINPMQAAERQLGAITGQGVVIMGGAGGDINAAQYLYDHGALEGWTVVQRTPGPQEGLA